jgi:ribonuclease J
MLEEAKQRTLASLREVAQEEVGDPQILRQHIRRTLGRFFFEAVRRKPVIVPVIMEV